MFRNILQIDILLSMLSAPPAKFSTFFFFFFFVFNFFLLYNSKFIVNLKTFFFLLLQGHHYTVLKKVGKFTELSVTNDHKMWLFSFLSTSEN